MMLLIGYFLNYKGYILQFIFVEFQYVTIIVFSAIM